MLAVVDELIGVEAPLAEESEGGRLSEATAVCGAAPEVVAELPGMVIGFCVIAPGDVGEDVDAVVVVGGVMLLGNVNPFVGCDEFDEPAASRVGARLFSGGISKPLLVDVVGVLDAVDVGEVLVLAPN